MPPAYGLTLNRRLGLGSTLNPVCVYVLNICVCVCVCVFIHLFDPGSRRVEACMPPAYGLTLNRRLGLALTLNPVCVYVNTYICVCVCVCVFMYLFIYLTPGRVERRRVCHQPTHVNQQRVRGLHVEYAERGKEYGIRFTFSPFYEHSLLEDEHVPV